MMCRSCRRLGPWGLALALLVGGCSSSTRRDQSFGNDAGTTYAIPDGGFLFDTKASMTVSSGTTVDALGQDMSPRADAGDAGAVSRSDSD